mgnify:CR=1 FL=1
MWKVYFNALNGIGDLLLGRELNGFRNSLGLPPITKVFDWWLSPQMILGFFPAWYCGSPPDWPSQLRTLAFSQFGGVSEPRLDPALEEFLRGGSPPVAITLGTGYRHGAPVYRAAVEGCLKLGRRAVLVTKYSSQIPAPLPEGVLAASFAPFSELFRRCVAVIHHGGIGTTAKALAAGAPQLIVPVCYDQLDNGTQVRQLGQGRVLSRRKASGKRVAEELAKVLALPRSVHGGGDRPVFESAAELIVSLANRTQAVAPSAKN